MMTAVATSRDTAKAVARPLNVLVPLIKKDLALGAEAAQASAMPYYKAAGTKMREAKDGHDMTGDYFAQWVKKNFGVSRSQAQLYMSYSAATENSAAANFKSMKDFRRKVLKHDLPTSGGGLRQPQWHEPIKESLGKVDPSKYEERNNARAEEQRLRCDLAFQLIDIGYKALVTKLHPDKGGSNEAMARLNAVKAKLRACAQK